MKYKYIKVKIIIPTLIVIMAAILVVMFFAGGLSAAEIKYENIEWDAEGFITPEHSEQSGWHFKVNDTEVKLNNKRYVGESDSFVMYVDESTTIVSVYRKLDGWVSPKEDPNANNKNKEVLLATSAQADGASDEAKSNITIYYYDKSGKENSQGLSSYDKSVLYINQLVGEEKYYKIRYNESSNSVDICYQIGEFNNIYATFPKYFDRADFENMFIGNTYVLYNPDDEIRKNSITDESKADASVDGYWIKPDSKIEGGLAYSYNKEAAKYMLKNDIATSIKYVNSKTQAEIEFKKDASDDDILACSDYEGYWLIYGIVDENGKNKLVYGVNCNNSESPVKVNPFLTSAMLTIITSNNFYSPTYYKYDEKGDKLAQEDSLDNRDHVFWNEGDNVITDESGNTTTIEKGFMTLKTTSSITNSKDLLQKLVIGPTEGIPTTQELPEYLRHSKNKNNINGFDGSHTYQVKINNEYKDVYYDYNNDGQISSEEKFIYGGYQARDPQNNYLFIDENNYVFYFDADGNRVLNDDEGVAQPVDSTGSFKPLQTGLGSKDVEEQNQKFNTTAESQSLAFQVCVRFEISNEGLDVTVLNNSVIEGLGEDFKGELSEEQLTYKHDNKLSKIEICKYMTVNNDPNSKGKIILPDGSGAVISFNTPKASQAVGKYNLKKIYGEDKAINREQMGYAQQNLMFPMYGFLETSDNRGIVAIVKKGAAQTSIAANYMTAGNTKIDGYNYAYFQTNLRESENVKITSSSSYLKSSDKLYSSDIQYGYHFLEDKKDDNGKYIASLTYVDVANDYRNYIIKEYGLEEKVDNTTEATPSIVFIGAYLKKTIKLGIVYDAEYSLTTFKQAGTIVKDLNSKGLSSMNVDYTLWTDDEGFDPISTDTNVSSVLGGKSDLMELAQEIKKLGFDMFLDYKVTSGYGYDIPFGALKYNAKSISGSRSNALEYVLSTGLADAAGKVGGRMSPAYYNSLLLQYLKNYNKLDIAGINLVDLGNSNTSDYDRQMQIYAADGTLYQIQALQTAKNEGKKVMLTAPYDYALKYVDVANNIPVETTLYPIVDNSIPLYQLVVSGLFDYTSKAINSNNDNSIEWNLLKAIETGSNLYFEISAEDTSVLLDTGYTSYYNSYYPNWKENILYMNEVLNSTGIYNCRLVDHEIITDTLVRVQYLKNSSPAENPEYLNIIINYSNNNYYDVANGIAVRANWFAIVPQENIN